MKLAARISQFANLVTRGIDAWVEAGTLLCQMIEDDPSVCIKITEQNPWITPDIINGFIRIGRKDIYPFLLLDQSFGARRLIELPYHYQKELYEKDIAVAVVRRGEIVTEHKRIQDLTKKEADFVLCDSGILPIAEQRKLLRPSLRTGCTTRVDPSPDAEPPRHESDEEPDSDDIDENLRRAQCCLLKVRAILGDSTTAMFEKHITNGLNAIGGLRFERNQQRAA